jgi:hypothetical protein
MLCLVGCTSFYIFRLRHFQSAGKKCPEKVQAPAIKFREFDRIGNAVDGIPSLPRWIDNPINSVSATAAYSIIIIQTLEETGRLDLGLIMRNKKFSSGCYYFFL